MVLIRPMEPRTYKVSRIITKSWAKGWHLYNTFLGKQSLKMVGLDLDGSALNAHKEIVPENLTAMQELKDKNPDVLFTIATGRGFHQALRFAQKIEADFFITDNGGAIYKRKGEGYELEKSFCMSERESQTFFNKTSEYSEENPEMIWHFSTDNIDHNFITGYGEDTLKKAGDTFYPREEFGAGVLQVKNFAEIEGVGLSNKIIKACVDFGKGEIGKKQFQEFENYLKENEINYFQTSDSKLEIAPLGVDKGIAILDIIKKEQERGNYINTSEILTLGDGKNDFPMFGIGTQGFCPANAKINLENVSRLKHDNNEPCIKEAIDNFQTKTAPLYIKLVHKAQSMINSQPKISGVDRWLAEARRNFGHTNTIRDDNNRESKNRPPSGRDR